jgi:hypothetical protein
MSGHEDVFYEIYQKVHSSGQEEVFYKQLEKMKFQDKHKYKCVKSHWEYAYGKITGAHQSDETLLSNQDSK